LKVFISSVINGFEAYRDAAAQGARVLRHQVLRAEDFGAIANSPQRVCLAAVREADVVVLIMGERYGESQSASGLSPTHEEFREALDHCQVLAFVQDGATLDKKQSEFVQEVRAWASGQYTASFSAAEELREAVTSALHDLELARKTGELDEHELIERARELVPNQRGLRSASLCTILSGGPRQQVIRPADIGKKDLANSLTQEALFGTNPVFDTSSGSTPHVEHNRLEIKQEEASILVDQLGTVRIVQPAYDSDDEGHHYLPVLVEEDVVERLQRSLRFGSWVLDRIDPGGRLTHVVPMVALIGADHMGWKTRAERRKNPNSVEMSMQSGEGLTAVLTPPVQPRPALRVQTGKLAEDLTVLLRRGMSQSGPFSQGRRTQ
jgi:hypothetical protein